MNNEDNSTKLGDDFARKTTERLRADILVVDDTPANLRLLVTCLRQKGYKVRPVTDGYAALKAVQHFQPDLILLDILMPNLNGYQVCEQLKANPETKEIPIIFLSALNEALDKAKGFQVGGVDYITKPFQIEEVLARVKNHIYQRLLQKQLREQAQILQKQNQRLQATIRESKLLEEKLLAAEKKMRGVFEAMTDIVIVVNFQANQVGNIDILPTNAVCIDASSTDIINQTIEQFFQPETASPWLSIFQQVLTTKQTNHLDYSIETEEKLVWLAAAISPFDEESVILAARDISDRKQAESALRIAEQRYHSIVENAIDGIFQSTPEGHYLNVNPALARIYGYKSPQELIQSVENIDRQIYVDPNSREEFKAAIAANNSVSGFESQVYRRDGSIIWISETARAVKNDTGKLLYYEGIVSDITERKLAQKALELQKAQTEQLLLNILPQPIADRLKTGESPIADQFEEVSVLFADLVGFTQFSAQKKPTELLEFLNEIFSEFDQLASNHSLEKIKTIGDAYMVVGGLPIPRPDATAAIAKMALDMQSFLADFNLKKQQNFSLRIGIHTGAVVAGVIGMSKFIYDLWGDTVNIASRMESSGIPGKIQVTSAVYERLKTQFNFEQRGKISVKGKGEMLTYLLIDRL
ncbi:adenylate/guanylate cyclase domain-containing protein [Oscillatoria salina]|uniref:adenylate/guanylate cyclase domain-containing protein n=1 Tax=Oscillatoria salina TaxID=331517 RepID=UPI001CCCE634|nr:adenylate/guanylate cyclase domain-containing protein [Oscillatoria salina]MBZ8180235.1 response regulator [Oscillatoria salina IIICB1]